MITHAYPRLNKEIPVAKLHPSFLDEDNSEPVPSILQVNKEKPASSLPKMSSEGFPEADSSLLGHEKTVGLRLLKPEGTSKEEQCQESSHHETSPPSSVIKEVSTLDETEGKAQKAPSKRVQEEGTPETRRIGVQQGGETNTELRQLEDPGRFSEEFNSTQGRGKRRTTTEQP